MHLLQNLLPCKATAAFWSRFVHAGTRLCSVWWQLVKTIFAPSLKPEVFRDCGVTLEAGSHSCLNGRYPETTPDQLSLLCYLRSVTNEPWMSWFLLAVHDWVTRPSAANMLTVISSANSPAHDCSKTPVPVVGSRQNRERERRYSFPHLLVPMPQGPADVSGCCHCSSQWVQSWLTSREERIASF